MGTVDEARRSELINRLANAIAQHGLKAPAIWFLEMHKPLHFLGAQALVFFEPLLSSFWNGALVRDWALLLEDRGNIELLLERLEEGFPVGSERKREGPKQRAG